MIKFAFAFSGKDGINCTARQYSPLRRKVMECYVIKPAQ